MPRQTIIVLFLLKVLAGLCIGYISLKYYGGGDYGVNNMYGREEYKLLMADPLTFFTSLLDSDYTNKYSGLFNSVGSFWHDLAGNFLYKLLGIFNIFSRGNYYINGLFLNVIGFMGHVALFRVFSAVYKTREWPVVAGSFLIPSTLYFTSGLHKDNLVFTCICLLCYALYFLFFNSFKLRKFALLFLAGSVLFLLRNHVFVAMLPAVLGLYIARNRRQAFGTFAWVYGTTVIIIICAMLLLPTKQPLQIIVQKQQDFLALEKARTQISVDTLKPTLSSFVKSLPSAFEHGFLRPYIWETWRPYLFIPAAEIGFYLLLMMLPFILKPHSFTQPHAFTLFGLFFASTLLLFIGFVIPNLGSIIRYRSLYLPFFVIPALRNCVMYYKKFYV